MKQETTFKALKASGYAHKTINQEIQANLISRIKAKQPVFEGLLGYEDTVVPQLKKAILAGHHINLLGLRGQAKTRIARSMVDLLDEYAHCTRFGNQRQSLCTDFQICRGFDG